MTEPNTFAMRGGLLIPTSFGYNAVEDKGRRQAPATRVRHESDILTPSKRLKMLATAQDQVRNHSLAAWMVRKHLDYVSKFHVSFRTGQTSLDNLVTRIFRWHGRPENMDYMGRLGRDEFFRFLEWEKVIAGDAGFLKLPALKMQAIEADEIAKPLDLPDQYKQKTETGAEAKNYVNDSGLYVDSMGVPLGYCLCKRTSDGRRLFYRIADKGEMVWDAYPPRFKSWYRGVSPLASAINTIQDLAEAFEFNLIKAKMHALFGVAVTRKDDAGDGQMGGAGGATGETGGAEKDASGSSFDLNPRAINIVDLNANEDIKTIESGTPSSEFIEGSYLFIHLAMLALDIPITCFDSRRSSFSARIADLNEYEVSVEWKRTKNRYVRQAYSDWLLSEIWNDPDSPWPLRASAEKAGITRLRELQEEVEWVPSGSPWLDKFKQLTGDELGISIGLDNAIDAARRRGGNVFENIDKQALVIAYAREKGVPLSVGRAADRSINDEDAKEQEGKDE